MYKKSPIKIIGIAIFVIAAMIAFGFVTMSLWNWLVPSLFNGPIITYWQAVGLLILSRILLPGGHGPGKSHRRSPQRTEWKARFKNRMEEDCRQTESATKKQPIEPSEEKSQ